MISTIIASLLVAQTGGQQLRPGITLYQETLARPLRINTLVVDLNEPTVSVGVGLSNDKVIGTERTSAMATRVGAFAAINADVWGPNGIESNLTIVDGKIVMAPKCRTSFGIRNDGSAVISRYSDTWAWQATVASHTGATFPITLLNNDLNNDWLCLYNDSYGRPTSSTPVAGETCEVHLDRNLMVRRLRNNVLVANNNQPDIVVPYAGYALVGRGAAALWLRQNLRVGRTVQLNLNSSRPWQGLRHAAGAGPRILTAGQYYADPIVDPWAPPAEEFPLSFKQQYYNVRQPRSAVGVSQDGRKVIFMTIDGRMSQWSVGVTLEELAGHLKRFGAWDGMNLDGGGSSTMVVNGQIINRPSDGANADGTGGTERSVANGILIFSRA